MADVDMTDAPSTSAAPTKKVASKAKNGTEGGDGKKRFEVKKVSLYAHEAKDLRAKLLIVECGRSVGLGYCR
jgi:RING-box protein 1